MKRFMTVLGIGFALAALAIPASAQRRLDQRLNSGQFSLRLGAYIPFEQNLRDLADVWFTAGGDYEVSESLIPNATTVVSIDWFGTNGGTSGNVFPIIVSQRWYTDRGDRRSYMHLGIGAAILNVIDTETVFAARAGVGMEFTENLFGEANVYWTNRKNGVDASGVAVYGGWRF